MGKTVIVCGGRDFDDRNYIWRGLDDFHEGYNGPIAKLVHGGAQGADSEAAEWAKRTGVKAVAVPARWKAFGKAAGPRRNLDMLTTHNPDCVLAFQGGRGTAHMISVAEASGVKVFRL